MHRSAPVRIAVLVVIVVCGTSAAASRAAPASHRGASAPWLLYTGDWSGSRQVYAVDPAHVGRIRQVTFAHERSCNSFAGECGVSGIVPSPDGRHIAFESGPSCGSGDTLYVSRFDGRARRRVARLNGCDRIAWSPDSKKLVYVERGDASIYVVRADGSGNHRLSYGESPTWSRDGRSLALLANRTLWIASNGRFRRVAAHVDTYSWSPAGKLLAIGTYDQASPYVREFSQVATIRPDGTGRRLLNGSTPAYEFDWSPSGRWVALSLDDDGAALGELDVVRPDGTQRRRFTDRGSGISGWQWSSDDRFISFVGQAGPTVIDIAGTVSRQFGSVLADRWSRRGHLLAFANDSGLSVLDPSTGTSRRLTAVRAGSIEWAPNDRSIAYVAATPSPFESGDLRLVTLSGQDRGVVSGSGSAGGEINSVTWIRPAGPLPDRRPAARKVAIVSADSLTAPWPIERIAADGDRVLYAACGHLFVWTPSTRRVVQAEPAASLEPRCSTPTNYLPFDVFDVALAGDRVAFGVRVGNMSQGWTLFQERLDDPAGLQRLDADFGVAGCTLADAGLGDLVGAGDLLLFSRWHEPVPDSQATCGHPTLQDIFRVDPSGCPCRRLATSPGPLLPADVDAGRVVAIGTNETLVLDPAGTPLLAIPVHAAAAQLAGSDLVVVVQGQLRDYDEGTGSLRHAWPLPDVASGGPCGSPHPWGCPAISLELDDAARGLAAYVLDGEIHVLRLSDGSDITVGKGVGARFLSTGVVYVDGSSLHLVPFPMLAARERKGAARADRRARPGGTHSVVN